jgi:GNAT superfamily N-acetyltransferase
MTFPPTVDPAELPGGPTRVARGAGEVTGAVSVLVSAFWDDPVWSWAFPDPLLRAEQYGVVWGMVAEASAGQGTLWLGDGSAAAWIPPGGDEMSAADADRLPGLLVEMIGQTDAEQVFGLWERFEQARPTEPHHYLSLLGTHHSRRGHGLGMTLLRETLREYESSGVACYLESSNPANNARYASVGFQPHGRVEVADGVPAITTMWRPARPA